MPNNTKKEECENKDKGCNHKRAENSEYCLSCQILIENKEEGIPMTMTSTASTEVTYTPSPQSPLGEEKVCKRIKDMIEIDNVLFPPSSNEDWEIEFDKLWQSLEPEVCTRVKTHDTHSLEDYVPLESDDIKNFIRTTRLEAQRSLAEEYNKNIGMLRQWLNEDRITDPKKMITNEDIKHWLKITE